MQLFTAISVKNKCNFLTILLQQKLALMITVNVTFPKALNCPERPKEKVHFLGLKSLCRQSQTLLEN